MSRSLRLARRPFIAFAIVLSPVVLIGMVNIVRAGPRADLVLAATLPFALYAALMLAICSTRVSVIDGGIDVSRYFVSSRFIAFAAIEHSDVQILAEREHPAFVTIHYRDGDGARKLRLSLKPYHRDDVAWFCALPEIKARTHPGLTRRL